MNNTKILVALSGGVDSSVATKILLNQGYDVIAATFFVTGKEDSSKSKNTILKAKAVAKSLGIEHHIIDFTDAFEKFVISNYTSEYISGRTPNPCAICNATVKMPLLWEKAQELGCEKLATGHYVKIAIGEDGRQYFSRGIDKRKDQAYFLWNVSTDIVQNLVFPLGEMEKTEVRQLAQEMNLSSADSPESQEVCFIDNDKYMDFLRSRIPKDCEGFQPGSIIDSIGQEVGRHPGYLGYTIGQRKGLGGGHKKRIFVTEINAKNKTVRIGENASLLHSNLVLDNINFHSKEIPINKTVFVQIRSPHKAVPGKIIDVSLDNKLTIKLDIPTRAVTPGQSGVLFIDNLLIGGGRIISSS